VIAIKNEMKEKVAAWQTTNQKETTGANKMQSKTRIEANC
jgi:hypothetical protein